MEEYFYSNCLIEALKAKIKNPKNVHIHKVPAKWNHEIFPHFWWEDGENAFEFLTKKDRHFQVLLFEGRLKKRRLCAYLGNLKILENKYLGKETIL